jgi:hypothetical protein
VEEALGTEIAALNQYGTAIGCTLRVLQGLPEIISLRRQRLLEAAVI